MSQVDPFSYVQRSFPPTVGCLSSPSVEQICQKNNLSFVELLRPFCLVNVDHRLRDPSGNDHPIQKLLINIQDVNDRPPQPSLAKKILNESVNSISSDNKTVTIDSLKIDVPAVCPWFLSWRNTFLQVQFPSDHEFVKHLLGCLLVTSSIDPPETLQSLLQSLQQMQAVAPARLPKWFSSTIFKYYVLIHDSKDGNKAKALNFFNSLKTAYGPEHCFFLEINSNNQDGSTSAVPDIWSNYITKKAVDLDGSDQGSSPRTPAEISGIAGMPNSVATDTEHLPKTRDPAEVAQEAGEPSVQVVLHPLSPDAGMANFNPLVSDQSQSSEMPKILNANVWNNMPNNFQFGAFLSSTDVDNVKSLVKHLALSVLIPHVEKQIFHLTDLASNKKGVSRSILSATKRLFGAPKPGSPGSTPLNSVIYAYDAPELQYRRLGDLYFMFTNYSQAFQAYHSAKRDFGADQAWIYYAGALEMAALSSYMQGEVTKKALDYMEEAILIYLNSCKLPQFATRATLLSTPFLRERHMYGEAAKQLIRMASEDSDLRSALLLEQASYCFLYSTKPKMSRKYAFHMVLAGHRFSKGGQKKHALRCYKQAFQLYQGKGWSLAEDHIHFTIGKLAGHLKLLGEGSSALASLLCSGSKQAPVQQDAYLREYLQMLQESNSENSTKNGLTLLPLPVVEDNSVVVLVSSSQSSLARAFAPDSPADSVRWSRMEELALTESQGIPMIFRPTIHLFSRKTVNTNNPVIVINEPLHVQVSLKNPLQIVLPMLRVQLLWNYTDSSGQVTCNEFDNSASDSMVKSTVLDCIQLQPSCTQQVTLSLVPLRPGQIDILGIQYSLSNSSQPVNNLETSTTTIEVQGKQKFVVRGPKVKGKNNKNEFTFEKDKRLEIKIVKSAPCLQLSMETNIKPVMLCGEIQEARMRLVNAGNSNLKNLFMVTSSPSLVSLPNRFVEKDKTVNEPVNDDYFHEYNLSRDKINSYRVSKIVLEGGELRAGQEMLLPLWIRAPGKEGPAKIDTLFYYENTEKDVGLGHRVSRYSLEMKVHHSLRFSASASRSTLCNSNDTMNINVTVENLNETKDPIVTVISLVQMSLASTSWRIHDKAIFSTELKLKSQERYYLLVKAIRTGPDGELVVTDCCFDDKPTPSGSEQPYCDFYKWDSQADKQENSSELFHLPLYLRWNAKIIDGHVEPRIAVGQSCVILNGLGVGKAWPREMTRDPSQPETTETLKIFGPERPILKHNRKGLKSIHLENALSFNLSHEHKVTHSFERSRICRVDLNLLLKNCVDYPVRVMINPLDSKLSKPVLSKTQLYTPHSSSTFSWTSRSSSLLRLEGHDQTTVQLSAAFSAPGTYDLGSRLSVAAATVAATEEAEADYVNQVCRVQSVIIILGSSDHS